MSDLKRRQILQLAAAALLKGVEPKAAFPTGTRERLAVSTYPFRSVIKDGMTLQQFAQTVRPKLGVSGIEPWSRHFQSTEGAYLNDLSGSFQNAGLHVVNIPVDDEVHLCGSAEERAHGLPIYRNWVDAAVVLRSPSIRVHLPRGEKGEQINCAVSAFKELAQYGAAKNIVINLENDDPKTEEPERIVRVIQTVGSPFLRALPDFCNSMLIHNNQAANNRELEMLFPLAFNISHVKDREVDNGKSYRVDLSQIFAIAKKSGYKGYFSMEWEGEGDPYTETGKLIEASLRLIG
ncbi:MAG: sugar phosphate isomerase/epimerase [Acidobacteriaceae bacterium]|nr:sugar phosphate isomerase/epimerase [Acidobacteriaceae bacterium]MBV9306752.1 sugar phosphate isomerase/epimerase [Acidobacteriaceae bacterium]